jgi:uncharacterized protein
VHQDGGSVIAHSSDQCWHPTAQEERDVTLDVLRGLALFGVLLVNLETLFRVSLFQHILHLHSDPGRLNTVVDVLLAGLLETKAVSLFSLMFGIGSAIQVERAAARGVDVTRFLVRRFLILLVLGLCHLLLIWNGDILVLYATCGLLTIPFLRLPAWMLPVLGAALILLPSVVDLPIRFPSDEAMQAQAVAAARVYGTGSVADILVFRYRETGSFIVPLLLAFMPQTAGLMLCGVAVSRSGVLREPQRHTSLLRAILVVAFAIGASATVLAVFSRSTGRAPAIPAGLLRACSFVPLAFSYAAGLLLWLTPARVSSVTALFAAAGQMALTNYLTESVVLGFIFYGYGFGLFGRMGSAPAALIGIALYTGQLFFSRMWLRRYRFGPVEWLWRSVTYGRLQRMSRSKASRHCDAPVATV